MIIYKITNKGNGKVYIGKTKKTPEARWKQHYRDAENPLKRFRLHEDILKYGKDCFDIEIVDEAATDEEACEKEIRWIEKCSCIFPNGYNVSKGGRNGGNTKKVMNVTTGEVFDSISDAAKKYNKCNRSIAQVLNKPQWKCAGCHWITIT